MRLPPLAGSVWVATSLFFILSHTLTTHAAPTCYEYHEPECKGGVQAMYRDLSDTNCTWTDPPVNDNKAWGATCLTEQTVAFTEMQPGTCATNYGTIQTASTCYYAGPHPVSGVDRWMYCTNSGCDQFGLQCTEQTVQTAADVQLYETCGGAPVYGRPIPADGECYKLPEAFASFRVKCINDQYVQAEIFNDEKCQYQAVENTAPSFMQFGGGCYQFQGNLLPFAMTVESPCNCGNLQNPDAQQDPLKFDVVYNLTVSGSNCLSVEADNMHLLSGNLTQLTEKEVEIGFLGSSLVSGSGDRPSYWILQLNVRFAGIREPDLTAFIDDMDRAVEDGRVLFMVETACGSVVDVTVENGGSTIHEGEVVVVDTSGALDRLHQSLGSVVVLTGFIWLFRAIS